MEFNINQIITNEDLSKGSEFIKTRLDQTDTLVVFDNNKPQFLINKLDRTETETSLPSSDENNAPLKIGELVRIKLSQLFKEGKISDNELNNLMTLDYSSKTFHLTYPMLKLFDPNKELHEQIRDSRGYNRYYTKPYSYRGNQYLLTSHWIEKNRESFIKWTNTLN